MSLSNRAYAKYRGVTEGTVRYAIKTGRITTNPDGSIDPETADRQWATNTDPSKSGRRKKSQVKKKKVPRAAIATVDNTLKEHGIEEHESAYMRAKTANEVLKAQIGKIELRKLKGELVDRNTAMAHVFKAARSERDAWLGWPARVSAEYAARLGVDEHKMYTALCNSVRNHLYALSKSKVPASQ